jgi:hypothetical protein
MGELATTLVAYDPNVLDCQLTTISTPSCDNICASEYKNVQDFPRQTYIIATKRQFLFQFCYAAKLVIVEKKIEPNLGKLWPIFYKSLLYVLKSYFSC